MMFPETGIADIGLRVGDITQQLVNVRKQLRHAGWDQNGMGDQEDAHHFYLALVNILKEQLPGYVSQSSGGCIAPADILLVKRCFLPACSIGRLSTTGLAHTASKTILISILIPHSVSQSIKHPR